MKISSLFQTKDQRTAIFFALLSQSIWLPVLFAGLQDHRTFTTSSDIKSYSEIANQGLKNTSSLPGYTSSIITQSNKKTVKREDTGIVLRSTIMHPSTQRFENANAQISEKILRFRVQTNSSTPISYRFSPNSSSTKLIGITSARKTQSYPSKPGALVNRLYTQAELLGGVLTMQNIDEPLMPAVARAERVQWMRSGDPLAPLPELWREPMRRALTSLINSDDVVNANSSTRNKKVLDMDSARFVHVPSTKVRSSREVPLALQADGSVDIFSRTDDPAILEEINRWSARQQLPAKGKVRPAVVLLHPLMNEPVDTIPRKDRILPRHTHPSDRPITIKATSSAVRESQTPLSPPAATEPQKAIPITVVGQSTSTSESPAVTAPSPAQNPEPLGVTSPGPATEAES